MAMEISVSAMGNVPVWNLSGRFDATGAEVLDRRLPGLDASGRWLVLDLKQVSFLSSAGIRSLIKLAKLLQQRKGRVFICGQSEFVAQTMSMAGLPTLLPVVASASDAAAIIARERTAGQTTSQREVNGRSYAVTRLPANPCTVEVWGQAQRVTAGSIDANKLITASLKDLGLAFGVGGLGNDRPQAAEALGLFVATGHLAWVLPADGHCLPDFIRTDSPADTHLHLAWGLGITGRPAVYIQGESVTLSVPELVHDVLALAASKVDAPAPVVGLLLTAEAVNLQGSYYQTAKDIVRNTPESLVAAEGEGIAGLGVLFATNNPQDAQSNLVSALLPSASRFRSNVAFAGQVIRCKSADLGADGADELELLKSLRSVDEPLGILRVGPASQIRRVRAWLFLPSEVREGAQKQVQIEFVKGGEVPAEWGVIIRRIYADSARVVLSPLSGGFSAATFQVTSYDREGRRALPTVLKISSLAFTDREEQAYHRHVEKFILNNSTVIMGRATRGQWAGLRYNFLGISGDEGGLSWMADHYVRRPVGQVLPLFDRLFSVILKPWYGQPRAEVLRPYIEHTPLTLFPGIFDDAQKHLGITPETETIPCPELGIDLPNPYHFLKYGYAQRREEGFPW